METKTHWRKGDESDYLMSWDIEAETRATIIKVVRIDAKIRGQMKNVRVAYFKEAFKPMVINVTNGRVIEKALGTHIIQDWHNISLPVILYVDENVKSFAGEKDRGLRIRPFNLPELMEGTQMYKNAIQHIKEGNDFKKIEEKFKLTPEIRTKIENAANGLS
jgi:hypothetical protein